MVRVCSIRGCGNNSTMKGISFHKVPRNPVSADLWRNILCTLLSNNSQSEQERLIRLPSATRICSFHFLDEDFKYSPNGLRLLQEGAVPSLFDKQPSCSTLKPVANLSVKKPILKKDKGENSIVSPKEKKSEKRSLQNSDLSDIPQDKAGSSVSVSPREKRLKMSAHDSELPSVPKGKVKKNPIKISPNVKKLSKESSENENESSAHQGKAKKNSIKISPNAKKLNKESLENGSETSAHQGKAKKNSIKISPNMKKLNKESLENGNETSGHQDEIQNSIQILPNKKKFKKGPVYISDLSSSPQKGDKYFYRPLRVKKPSIKLKDFDFDSGFKGEDVQASRNKNKKHIIIVRGSQMFAAVTEKHLQNGKEVWKTKHIVRIKNANCPKLLIRNVDLFARVEVDNELMEPLCEIQTYTDEDEDGRAMIAPSQEQINGMIAPSQEQINGMIAPSQEQINESTTVALKIDEIHLTCPECKLKNEVAILKPYQISSEFSILLCPTEECLYPLWVTELHTFLYKNLPNGSVMQCSPAEAPTLSDIVAVLSSDKAKGSSGTS